MKKPGFVFALALVGVFSRTGAQTLGPEFRVNTFTTGDQRQVGVAVNATGDFVVVWDSIGQDGDQGGIYAQRFNASGTPKGLEFRVNVTTAGDQVTPKVAYTRPDDDLVFVWTGV